MQEMHRVFDRSTTGLDVGQELMRLQQGSSSVSDYAIEFQTLATLATDSGREGNRAVVEAFLHGLSEQVKDELLTGGPGPAEGAGSNHLPGYSDG